MKPTLILKRLYLGDVTLGVLRSPTGDFNCFTLELPWVGNQRSVSCIPEGTYEVEFRESPKNGNVFELKDVKDRSYIQIHQGNFHHQTEGCILVGENIGHFNQDNTPDVGRSKAAMYKLLNSYRHSGFYLIIESENYGGK